MVPYHDKVISGLFTCRAGLDHALVANCSHWEQAPRRPVVKRKKTALLGGRNLERIPTLKLGVGGHPPEPEEDGGAVGVESENRKNMSIEEWKSIEDRKSAIFLANSNFQTASDNVRCRNRRRSPELTLYLRRTITHTHQQHVLQLNHCLINTYYSNSNYELGSELLWGCDTATSLMVSLWFKQDHKQTNKQNHRHHFLSTHASRLVLSIGSAYRAPQN